MSWLLPLALACTAGGEPDSAGESGSPEPDVDWSPAELVPELTVADLEAGVASADVWNFLHPNSVSEWLTKIGDDMRQNGRGTCPGPVVESTDSPGALVEDWQGICSTEEYQLVGGWLSTHKQMNDEFASFEISALLSIRGEGPGGLPVDMAGVLIGRWGTEGEFVPFDYELSGDFRDASASDGLSLGGGGRFEAAGGWSAVGGLRAEFDGSMASPDLPMELEAVSIDATCGPGATGTLRVRDPSTGWWQIDMAEDCSGCGPASFGGVEQGEACVGAPLAEAITASFQAEWP